MLLDFGHISDRIRFKPGIECAMELFVYRFSHYKFQREQRKKRSQNEKFPFS